MQDAGNNNRPSTGSEIGYWYVLGPAFDRLRDRLKIIQYGALRQAQGPQLTHNSTATSLRLAMISQGAL